MLNQVPSAKRQCRSPASALRTPRTARRPTARPGQCAAADGHVLPRREGARNPKRAAAASIWRIQDGATVLCLRGPLVPLTQSRFHCQRCSAPSSHRINLEPRAVNAMSIPPGQHPPDLPLDRRLAGCHLRLSRRAQCQPQAVRLDPIRGGHYGQTRSPPCNLCLIQCTRRSAS